MAIAAAAFLIAAVAAEANPLDPTVRHGAAAFAHAGGALTVTNAPGTIVDWRQFSIAAGESTHFAQPAADSAVLNRVTGGDPSAILGRLSSNGRVFLVNPQGIVFGPGARVDTAGLVASALDIGNEDFLAGRLRFAGTGDAAVTNAGVIHAEGDVHLVGPRVENSGLITSAQGSVVLAAGHAVTITSADAHGVVFEVQAPEDTAVNLGTLEGGTAAALFGARLRHSGAIRAGSASRDAQGRVVLAARDEAVVDGTATIDVDNAVGRGGQIAITGTHVGVLDEARVSARGAMGGGEILVGGDAHGANPAVANAEVTIVTAGTRLDASAADAGDGGRVIVWADDTARVHGTIAARGGAADGDGGFVETSGRRFLDVTRAPDVAAPAGQGGEWLLDPEDIVVSAAANSNATAAPLFQPAAAGSASVVNIGTLQAAVNAGGTVTLDTTVAGGGGSGNGDITFAVAPSFAPGAPAVLNLKAHRNITLASLAESGVSTLTVNFLANQAGPAGGIARINGPVTSNGGLALGGAVTLLGQGTSHTPNFRVLAGATVTLDSGGPADFVYSGGTVEIDGTLAWEGNAFNIRGAVGTTFNINAGGVFDIRNDRTMVVFGGAGSAALNVLAGGTLRKSAGAGTTLLSAGQGWTLTNAGTVEALAGTLYTGQGASHTSSGTLHAEAGGRLALDNLTLTGGAITGGGTVNAAGNGLVVNGAVAVENFALSGSTLTVGAAGALNLSGAFDWTAGTIAGSGAINIAPGALFTANGSGADLLVDGAVDINNSGTLRWSGTSNLRGRTDSTINNLAGGLFDIQNDRSLTVNGGDGQSFLNNAAGAVIRKTAGAGTTLLSAGQGWRLNNAGTVEALTGTLYVGQGATHTSSGTLRAESGGRLALDNLTLTGGAITGTGTVNTAGNGLVVNGAVAVENFALSGSTLTVGAAGALNLSGAFDWTGGTIAGSGAINIAPGALFTANGSGADLLIDGAVVLNNSGTLRWSGASNLRGRVGHTINNLAGGLFDIQNDRALTVNGGDGQGFLNNAAGAVIRKTAGAGDTALSTGQGWALSNAGLIDVQSGTMSLAGSFVAHNVTGEIRAANTFTFGGFGGSIVTLGDGTLLSGNGTFVAGNSPLVVSGGAAGATIATGTTFNLNGQTIGGAGKLTNQGTLLGAGGTVNPQLVNDGLLDVSAGNLVASNGLQMRDGTLSVGAGRVVTVNGSGLAWQGGTLAGAGTYNLGGGLTITGAGTRILAGPTFNIPALTLPGGSLTVQSGTLNLSATTTIASGATLAFTGGALNLAGPLDNAGTFSVASGLFALGNGGNHAGTFSAAGGATIAFAGGTHDLGAGTVLDGGGAFTVTGGTVNISGADVTLAAGSSLSATAQALGGSGKLINLGALALTDSTFAGSLDNLGTLTLAGATAVGGDTLNQGAITVASGTADFGANALVLDGGSMTVAAGATLTKAGGSFTWNAGTLAGGGSYVLPIADLNGGASRILNGPVVTLPRINLNGGSLALQAGSVTATNKVNVAGGTLLTLAGGSLASAGSLDVDGEVVLGGGALAAGLVDLHAGGVLRGSGTVTGPLLNNGTVDIGASPGLITVNGDYTQFANGLLEVELGGLAPGSGFDQLVVTGQASLGGALAVQLFGGFVPPDGALFDLLTFASVVGDFATVTLPVNGQDFATAVLAQSYRLSVTGAPPVVPPPVTPPSVTPPAGPGVSLDVGALAFRRAFDVGIVLNDRLGGFVDDGTKDDAEDDDAGNLVCR
ncbi:MAG: filamentous hemagglutinin N-terminal domain-containing protein [Gammaproteobacteria bacterium]